MIYDSGLSGKNFCYLLTYINDCKILLLLLLHINIAKLVGKQVIEATCQTGNQDY